MTDLLKDVLHGVVEEAGLPDVDQARAMAAGRSRLRRRRLSVGAGVGAAVLVAAVAVPLGLQAVDSDSAQPAGPGRVHGQGAFAERQVTFAEGSEIHYGEQVISVAPHPIKTFVQTDDGFAFVSGDDVYFTDGAAAEQIGVAGAPYGRLLAADDSGSLVAWVDLSMQGKAVYQAFDTSTGDTESLTKPHSADGEFEVPSIAAVDGSTVYAWGDEGVFGWDLRTGESTVLKQQVNNDWLLDVSDGWMAFDDSEPDGGIRGDEVVIAKNASATAPRYPSGRVDLSPAATYFANDHDDSERILARDGGADVTPDLAGYQFMGLVQWIDDDRFAAVGFATVEADQLDLLECSVSAGSCEAKVRGIAYGKGLALPIGSSIDD